MHQGLLQDQDIFFIFFYYLLHEVAIVDYVFLEQKLSFYLINMLPNILDDVVFEFFFKAIDVSR
jgi:hypothetical protein